MTYDTPYYSVRLAFEPYEMAVCFGWDGLLDTMALLEPSIYFVSQDWRQVGMIEVFADGRRKLVMEDRTIADEDGFSV